ncbi:MAG: hypothetical protein MJ114_04710 [Acetatifactor sp.]|nr:hypothetical protein [Acetatifactor sp.]
MSANIVQYFSEADLILVGLGEDFNDYKRLANSPEYAHGKEWLLEHDLQQLLPAWTEFCSRKLEDIVTPALEKLRELLKDKNYFVITTSVDSRVFGTEWKNGWFVSPCGNLGAMQCKDHAEHPMIPRDEGNHAYLNNRFETLYAGKAMEAEEFYMGVCPECHAPLQLNTVFAANYNESGYLPKWDLYKKWLQGTINKKVVLLELGVSLAYPSVIRWPFEKVAFYNQKSTLIRVNEKFPQPTAEISERCVSVEMNALEWIQSL